MTDYQFFCLQHTLSRIHSECGFSVLPTPQLLGYTLISHSSHVLAVLHFVYIISYFGLFHVQTFLLSGLGLPVCLSGLVACL